jgi:hypothetical protein
VSTITVRPIGDHQYGVQVREGDLTTSHRVTVPQDMLDEWGMLEAGADDDEGTVEERIVRESFAFLLEREPATSILDEFSLSVIPRYFPEYSEELARRLS